MPDASGVPSATDVDTGMDMSKYRRMASEYEAKIMVSGLPSATHCAPGEDAAAAEDG